MQPVQRCEGAELHWLDRRTRMVIVDGVAYILPVPEQALQAQGRWIRLRRACRRLLRALPGGWILWSDPSLVEPQYRVEGSLGGVSGVSCPR